MGHLIGTIRMGVISALFRRVRSTWANRSVRLLRQQRLPRQPQLRHHPHQHQAPQVPVVRLKMVTVGEQRTSAKAPLSLILLVLMPKLGLVLISVVLTLKCGVETNLEMDWLLVNVVRKSARLNVKTRTRKRMKKTERSLKGNARRKEETMRRLGRKQKEKGRKKGRRMSGIRSERGRRRRTRKLKMNARARG